MTGLHWSAAGKTPSTRKTALSVLVAVARAVAVCAMLLCCPLFAHAAERLPSGEGAVVPMGASQSVIVGVIDMQRILAEASAAHGLARQREQYLARYQSNAVEQEKLLAAEDQSLASQQSQLSRDVFNARQDAFRKKLADYQLQGQTRRANLERAYRQGLERLEKVIIQAASGVASEEKMTYVLYRTQVFLFDHRLDITDTVLQRVNRGLPSVDMPDPDSLPPEPELQGAVDQIPLPHNTP